MQELFNIETSRLVWDPTDRRKVSQGGTLLGEGTFGSVFRGKFNHTYVAIKVLKNSDGYHAAGDELTAAEQQHVREIRRLMELKFKHVVQCLGISKSPLTNHAVIVTECLEGGSLFDALQVARLNDARLTDISFLTIASHIAKGLLYVHQSGFIHGDMKPHNVLLSGKMSLDKSAGTLELPPNVDAKIADFGMSKRVQARSQNNLMDSSIEMRNQSFGTYAYMAPEILQGVPEKFSTEDFKRVDMYAFGVVLYEMLTGVSPWELERVDSPMRLCYIVCSEKRRPAWGPRSDQIPREYKRMIERCWDQENRRRPDADEIIAALEGWIEDRNAVLSNPDAAPAGRTGATSPPSHDPPEVKAGETDALPGEQGSEKGDFEKDSGRRSTSKQQYWEYGQDGPYRVEEPYGGYDPGESAVNLAAASDNPNKKSDPVSSPETEDAHSSVSKDEVLSPHVDAIGHVHFASSETGSFSSKMNAAAASPQTKSTNPSLNSSHVTQSSESADGQQQGESLSSTRESIKANEADQIPTVPLAISSEMVVQAFHATSGEEQIFRWWNEGHMEAIAAALRNNNLPVAASTRVSLTSELLKRIPVMPATPMRQVVARDLCQALGDALREPTITPQSTQGGVAIVLNVLRSFSRVLPVYGRAFYALANLLKISNEFPDDEHRRELLGWLSHAMSYNISVQPDSRVPTVAYTTACVVRNFVWMNDANSQVFFEREDENHGSALELLLASLVSFRLDPTIAEACLSAFAALAYYPRRRISLVQAQVVSTISQVLRPPAPGPPTTFNVLSMGLSTLGILITGPVVDSEGPLIGTAFCREGGISCAIYALNNAIAKRDVVQMEASMSAMATIVRFNLELRDYTIHLGGVTLLIQAVMYAVMVAETISPHCAEMICVTAHYFVYNDLARATMRQNNVADRLALLIAHYPGFPRVSISGQQAIACLQRM